MKRTNDTWRRYALMLRKKLSKLQSQSDRTYNQARKVEAENRQLKQQLEDQAAEVSELRIYKHCNVIPFHMARYIFALKMEVQVKEYEIEQLRAQLRKQHIEIMLPPAGDLEREGE